MSSQLGDRPQLRRVSMKKDLIKLAMVGLLAGLCLSAQQADAKNEVAMTKCSKEKSPETQPAKKCNEKSDCNSCNSSNGCNGNEESDATDAVQSKRKSAARKVVEGK